MIYLLCTIGSHASLNPSAISATAPMAGAVISQPYIHGYINLLPHFLAFRLAVYGRMGV
jgi:hypothetical protein